MKYLFVNVLLISSIAFLGASNAAVGSSEENSLRRATSSSSSATYRESSVDSTRPTAPSPRVVAHGVSDETSSAPPPPLTPFCCAGVSFPPPASATTASEGPLRSHTALLGAALYHRPPVLSPVALPFPSSDRGCAMARRLFGLRYRAFGLLTLLTDPDLIDSAVAAVSEVLEPLRRGFEGTGVPDRVRQTGVISEGDLDAFRAYHRACCDRIDGDPDYKQPWKSLVQSSFCPVGSIAAELHSLRTLHPSAATPSFTIVRGVSPLALSQSPHFPGSVFITCGTFDGRPLQRCDVTVRDYGAYHSTGMRAAMACPAAAMVNKFYQQRAYSVRDDNPLLALLPEEALAGGILTPGNLTEAQAAQFLRDLEAVGGTSSLTISARWILGPALSVCIGAPCFDPAVTPSRADVAISTHVLRSGYRAATDLAAGRALMTGRRTPLHVFLVEQWAGTPPEAMGPALGEVINGARGNDVHVFFHVASDNEEALLRRSLPVEVVVDDERGPREFFGLPPSSVPAAGSAASDLPAPSVAATVAAGGEFTTGC